MAGPEYQQVELPFIEQLQAQGWEYVQGSLDDPVVSDRDSFAQVIQEQVLREQLYRINRRAGQPWLDDERLAQAIGALTRLPAARLMEANQQATELLLNGIAVDGLPDWDGGRGQTIRYLDWDDPDNNRFTVINQYKVKAPPGHDAAHGHVIPDLVLLVNGIPLVVVECKGRMVGEGLSSAVDQLRRYANQRKAAFEVEQNEGAPALFHTNQFLVATNFDDARVGTIGAGFAHFLSWKTVAPETEAEVCSALGITQLSGQQRLVAGMLTKRNLLDIIRHFTLFMNSGGQTIKLVCRYQQFRAVSRAIERLKSGLTRLQDGEFDRRGGIIWHTQGSGKSLTMVFLVRKLRTDPALRRFKVVVITDRKDLQEQLAGTANLTGEMVEIARNTDKLKALVKRPGPGLLFATIQKYREPDADDYPVRAGGLQLGVRDAAEPMPGYGNRPFELLNDSADILVMIDEAHRTQAGDLHANLLRALPNCARIGFTGTPIIMGEKKRTHEIFGEFIDRYTIKESERDGATVPVLYEGRTATGGIKDGGNLDELFEDLFRERTPEELEAIRQKYATKGVIMEAPALIAEKAADMLRHYVINLLPNGYKAQVAAYSRRAAVAYQKAFEQARAQLLEEALALDPADKALDYEALMRRPYRVQAAVQAWHHRELLKDLQFAAVISASHNDDPEWARWSDAAACESHIARFKKPLTHPDPDKRDPLAFLIVRTMLLTGFDAPIEAVLYLDRPIREADLLQAIARVNRTGFGKLSGLVVDYYGVAHHLQEALAAYSAEDIEGALQSLKDDLPLLRDRHLRTIDVLRSQGVESLDDVEAAVLVLADERVRADFTVKFKQFTQLLDEVLPRPEGLEFTADAKRLALIYARARQRYKEMIELGKDIGAKVRRLVEEHVISLGIDPRIPPVQLTDSDFAAHINRQISDRAKASEMEHAIRSHVRKHMDEDPVKYGKLSERLRELLQKLDGRWQEQIEALSALIKELQDDQAMADEALPDVPAHYLPFLRLLTEAAVGEGEPDAAQRVRLAEATAEIVDTICGELRIPGFWKPAHIPDQERLKGRLFEELFNRRLVPMAKLDALVDRLLELARANHDKLVAL